MNINDEYKKWRKGESKLEGDKLAIVKAYDIMLAEISTDNIMFITDEFERLLNEV